MYIRKIILLVTCICFASFIASAQSEAMKDVINNLALYHTKNELKYLGDSKKSVDATFKTHGDSTDMGKNVYKAMVYATILNIDSLNKLGLPDTMLLQTTRLVNRLLAMRKIYRYNIEMNYARGCLANVYQRKAFGFYDKNNFRLAIANFNVAKRFVPAAKEIDVYLANIYYKTGNYRESAMYYDTVLTAFKKPRLEHIQTAANVYLTLGDTTKSLQVIQRGLDVYPDDKYLLFEEANIYNNQKNYSLLKPLLGNLMAASPNDANVLFMAANCYDHLNDMDRAEHLYQKVIEINNTDYDPIFNLGLLYLKKALHGKKSDEYQASLSESKNWLEKANEMAPGNEACLKALQMLYLQSGDQSQLKKVNNKLNQLTN